jgi:hypothetical protein
MLIYSGMLRKNPVMKYLHYADHLELFRLTENYMAYDFERMKEIISKDDEQNTYIDIEDSEESSSNSSSSCDINGDIVSESKRQNEGRIL